MGTVMANDRLKFAIGRLERASARVERIVSETRASPVTAQPDHQLQQKHDKLRQHVQSVISRIDGLIASSGR
jgi:hypothetical protein